MQTDDNLLSGINLDQFNEADKQKIVKNIYKQLEDRVGDKVQSLVNDEQFAQFEAIVDKDDEAKMDEWLDKNVPGYEQIVQDVLKELKKELASNPQSFL